MKLIETIFHFNKEAGGTQFLYKLNFSEIYLSRPLRAVMTPWHLHAVPIMIEDFPLHFSSTLIISFPLSAPKPGSS